MRTLTPSQRSAAGASELVTHVRQEITDADGVFRNVSTGINGPDFLNGGSIDETLDGNSQQFALKLLRDAQYHFQLNTNPEFAGGSIAGYAIYDNGASGSVSIAAEAFASPFNRSGYRMRISHTTAGTPSPGWGGFVRNSLSGDGGTYRPDRYHPGATLLFKIILEIPVGYTVAFASNAIGTGGTITPITSLSGTGAPFEYIWKIVVGATGTFATTGYFYLSGGTRPVTWYAYSYRVIDESAPVSLAPLRGDSAINRNAAGSYAPLIDLRRKWRTFVATVPKDAQPGDSRKNEIDWSYDLTHWNVPSGVNGSATLNAIGINGQANTATTLADTDATNVQQAYKQFTIPADTRWYYFQYRVAKDAVASPLTSFFASLILTGVYMFRRLDLNTSTGAFTVSSSAPAPPAFAERVTLWRDNYGKDWWIVEMAVQNDGTRTQAQPTNYIAGPVGTDQRSVVIGHSELIMNQPLPPAPFLPIVTNGSALTVSDWEEIGNGFIDRIEIEDESPVINITGRDSGAVLLDAFIRTKRSYGSSGGTAIATVLQQMIDDNATDNGYSGITLTVDASAIAFLMNPFTQDVGGLMQALNTVAGKAGMVVRYRYNAADQLVLTLYSPNRSAAVEDWSIGPSEYLNIPLNALDIEGVRNLVVLRFFDTASSSILTVQSPTSGTSASITKYGLRPLFIDAAADSGINSTAKAQTKADAVRLDLETPSLEQQIESYSLWFAQLGDYVKLLANGVHYDTDQFGGVTSIHHDFSSGVLKTTLGLKGKPAGRYRTWLAEGQSDAGPTAPTPPAGSISPPTALVTQSAITAPTLTTESLTISGTTNRGAAADLLMFWRYRTVDSRTGAGAWSAWTNNTGINSLPLEAAVTRGLKWKKTFEFQTRDETGQVTTASYDVASKMDAVNDSGVVDDSQNMSSGAPPFRKTIDTTASVVSVSSRGFIDQAGLDLSLRPTSVFRGAGYEAVTNLFKRGTDSAADVVITTTRTFVDPNSATQVDASGRIVGVYRLGVYEPVNNLMKAGDALGAASATTLALTGTVADLLVLQGSPTTGLQISIGDSSVAPRFGSTYSGGYGFIAYNARQTYNTDQWTQNLGSIASTLFEVAATYVAISGAPVGQAAAARATFWTSRIQIYSNTGSIGLSGILRAGNQSGTNGLAGDIVAARATNQGVYYFGNSPNAYLYFDGTWVNFGAPSTNIFRGLVMSSPGMALVGNYDPAKWRPIYSIGTLYTPPADGTSITGCYGLYFIYDTTAGGGGVNATGGNRGHGIAVVVNGVVKFFAGSDGPGGSSGVWSAVNMVAPDFILS